MIIDVYYKNGDLDLYPTKYVKVRRSTGRLEYMPGKYASFIDLKDIQKITTGKRTLYEASPDVVVGEVVNLDSKIKSMNTVIEEAVVAYEEGFLAEQVGEQDLFTPVFAYIIKQASAIFNDIIVEEKLKSFIKYSTFRYNVQARKELLVNFFNSLKGGYPEV